MTSRWERDSEISLRMLALYYAIGNGEALHFYLVYVYHGAETDLDKLTLSFPSADPLFLIPRVGFVSLGKWRNLFSGFTGFCMNVLL